MKIITSLLLFIYAGFALADTTLTIVIPTADEARVTEAFGSILNLGHAATVTDIEGAINTWMGGQVTDYEKRKNMTQFSPPPLIMLSPVPAPTGIPMPTPGGSEGEGSKAKATQTPKKKK